MTINKIYKHKRNNLLLHVHIFKVLGGFGCVYSLLPFLPIGWTNFPDLINPLARLHQPQRFIHRPSNSQIIDAVVTDGAGGIEEDEAA